MKFAIITPYGNVIVIQYQQMANYEVDLSDKIFKNDSNF